MKFIRIFLITLFLSVNAFSAQEESPMAKLKWQFGPKTQAIDNISTLKIPNGYGFLDKEETKKYSELAQNPSQGLDSLFTGDNWEAYFHFEATGYVKDDETLDADELLKRYKEGTRLGNEERKKKGWATLEIDGWYLKPHYDKEKKLLEWAFTATNSDDKTQIVNYCTRVLGRTGVMKVTLVTSTENIASAIVDFKEKLSGFEFNAGEKYTEFKQGDKVAEYGLAALILGGAAAVATKKGFWAVLAGFFAAAWKLIFIPIILFFTKVKEMIVSIFKKSDK
jgi:uncharacterized membrane-anchored protein